MEADGIRGDSVRSVESGYCSVDTSNMRKCNVCDSTCSDPIVAWFSRQETNSTTTTTTTSPSGRPRSFLVGVGQVCENCFEQSPMASKEENKRLSIIHRYNSVGIESGYTGRTDDSAPRSRSKCASRLHRCTNTGIAFIIVVLLIIILTLIVILISTGVVRSPDSHKAEARTATLQTNLVDLHHQLDNLQKQINILKNQTIQHHNNVDTVLANHTRILQDLAQKGSTNRTEPPVRQPGGDSECSYFSPRQHTSAAESETRTSWFPTDRDKQMVITGVDCSVTGGSSSQLETRLQNGFTQYSCVCPPQRNSQSLVHTCIIHVWSCSSVA